MCLGEDPPLPPPTPLPARTGRRQHDWSALGSQTMLEGSRWGGRGRRTLRTGQECSRVREGCWL